MKQQDLPQVVVLNHIFSESIRVFGQVVCVFLS